MEKRFSIRYYAVLVLFSRENRG